MNPFKSFSIPSPNSSRRLTSFLKINWLYQICQQADSVLQARVAEVIIADAFEPLEEIGAECHDPRLPLIVFIGMAKSESTS